MEATSPAELMTEALELLVRALNLLDEAEAPGDIGAHLDLARERLSRTLEVSRVSGMITRQATARSTF